MKQKDQTVHQLSLPPFPPLATQRCAPGTGAATTGEPFCRTVSSLFEWQQVMSETFVPVVASPVATGRFSAELRARPLEAVRLARLTATPHRLRRFSTFNGATRHGHYLLVLPGRGSIAVNQDGRQAALLPGDWSICDTTRPYELRFGESAELLMVMFPHRPLTLPTQAVKGLTATRLSADDGLAAVVLPPLVRLEERLDSYHPWLPARLAADLLNLLATLVLESGASTAVGRQALLLLQIERWIDARLADPSLSAHHIAAAHHISTRYLRRLFASQGATVSGWIRQRRLERCREELTDPTLAHLPVSVVAARWGLLHAAHFSRLFRSTFGESPRDCRRAHLSARVGFGQPKKNGESSADPVGPGSGRFDQRLLGALADDQERRLVTGAGRPRGARASAPGGRGG